MSRSNRRALSNDTCAQRKWKWSARSRQWLAGKYPYTIRRLLHRCSIIGRGWAVLDFGFGFGFRRCGCVSGGKHTRERIRGDGSFGYDFFYIRTEYVWLLLRENIIVWWIIIIIIMTFWILVVNGMLLGWEVRICGGGSVVNDFFY